MDKPISTTAITDDMVSAIEAMGAVCYQLRAMAACELEYDGLSPAISLESCKHKALMQMYRSQFEALDTISGFMALLDDSARLGVNGG